MGVRRGYAIPANVGLELRINTFLSNAASTNYGIPAKEDIDGVV